MGLPHHIPGCALPLGGDGRHSGKTMASASKQQVAQIALVELKRQDPATYRESHPQAYRYNQFSHPVRVFPMNQYRVQARTDCRQGRQH